MQNFFGSLGGIAAGTLYYPLGQNDGKLPHVDLMDVGKVRVCVREENEGFTKHSNCKKIIASFLSATLQAVAAILVNPEPHAGKTYNLVGEYQSGSFIVRRTISLRA